MTKRLTKWLQSKPEPQLESVEIPLIRRLRNIKNAKVQETSWEKICVEIKEWAYVDKKMKHEAEKKATVPL